MVVLVIRACIEIFSFLVKDNLSMVLDKYLNYALAALCMNVEQFVNCYLFVPLIMLLDEKPDVLGNVKVEIISILISRGKYYLYFMCGIEENIICTKLCACWLLDVFSLFML